MFGVEVARAIADVLAGKQDLAHRDAVLLERLLVLPHQRGLPDRRRGLLLGDHRGRPLRPRRATRWRWPRRTRGRPRVCPGRAAARSPASRPMSRSSGPSPGRGDGQAATLTTTRRARISERREPMARSSGTGPSRGPARAGLRRSPRRWRGTARRCSAQKRSTAAPGASVPGSFTLFTGHDLRARGQLLGVGAELVLDRLIVGERIAPRWTDRDRSGARAAACARCGAGTGCPSPCPRPRRG